MAKKRVHEIAKERGISSKEVLAVLQKAGLDVKAAASSVDEGDIARAFSGGNGADAPGGVPRGAGAGGRRGRWVRASRDPRGPQAPPPPQQPPRRGRGRRRRT